MGRLLTGLARKALLLVIVFQVRETCGQSFFDIIPNLQSVEMQGGCRVLYALDSNFVVFGHRYDTSYAGSNAKPWMGTFDYDGQMTALHSLRDTTYETPFNISFLQFAQKSPEKWLGYSARFINSISTPYLYELDMRSGKITSAVLLPNKSLPGEIFGPCNIYYSNNRISLLSYNQDPDSVRLFITELDTNFNFLREFRVQPGARKQFPKFFERQPDGTYIMIADSRRTINDNYNLFDAMLMHIDSNGYNITSRWSPSLVPVSNTLTAAKCILRGRDGNWVLLGHHILYPDSCPNCQIITPFKYSVSPNFDTLLWQINFRDIPIETEVLYHELGLTEVSDGFVGCGTFFHGNIDWRPSSGRIYKTSLNGDSLWTRNIIPIGWEEDRVVFADFYDVKETPFGTLVVAGHVVDRELEITRPWILHLDKNGCLVPGCHIVGTHDPSSGPYDAPFGMYPNPFSKEIYILSRIDSQDDHLIRLFSNYGAELRRGIFQPLLSAQYILTTENLVPGTYYLSITNQRTGHTVTFPVIKH